jgi:hypothetical protein
LKALRIRKEHSQKDTGYQNPEIMGRRDTIILQRASSFPLGTNKHIHISTHNYYLAGIPPRIPLWARKAPTT